MFFLLIMFENWTGLSFGVCQQRQRMFLLVFTFKGCPVENSDCHKRGITSVKNAYTNTHSD